MNLRSITVIIPTRNCLSQVLEGLPVMEEWLPFVGEVIVVDSQSSDGTREALRRRVTGAHVRFIDHPPGLYASWNAGIKAATKEFIHISTAGDTISASDLEALVQAADAHSVDVVCAPPHFYDQAGRPVEGPRWPVHELAGRRLEGLELLAAAMNWCQVPLKHMSWLGSSASNLYRRSVFNTREFPLDVGHSGDMMFGLRHAPELSAVFLKEKRGRFVLHESAGSRADLFDAYGEAYASQYASHRELLLKSLHLDPMVLGAISFDAQAVRAAFARERAMTLEERAKKEALQKKLKSDPAKAVIKHLEARIRSKDIGFLQRHALRKAVDEFKAKPKPVPAPVTSTGSPVRNATCIITAAEINDRHGTGVLLERIFRQTPDYVHLRSMNLYGGQTGGGQRLFCPDGRPDLMGSSVSRILAVPYSRSDAENALHVSQSTGAPMIVWLMDHHLGDGEHQIPPPLMQQLLDRAGLRLGISPEFCTLYEQLFGHRVHFAPPVVEANLAQVTPLTSTRSDGALLGNLWSQKWLEMLARTLDLPVTSYGHNSPQWVKHEALAAHVTMRGFLPEEELVRALRQHPYAIVPTGTLDSEDDLPDIARYSLPSRTLYLSAVANLPIIVLGHENTGVARFVTRQGLGLVAPYAGLRDAANTILANPMPFREKAARLAPVWACDDMQEWLWKSLELGRPADERWAP